MRSKSADDTLLTGSHSVHGLDPGASHSATVTVTIPAATPPNAYFLLACADGQNAVAESNERQQLHRDGGGHGDGGAA